MSTTPSAPSGSPSEPASALHRLLALAVGLGASDLHLSSGHPPLVRVEGQLRPLEPHAAPLSEAHTQALLREALAPDALARHARGQDVDVSLAWPGLARFRLNAYRQREGAAAAFRVVHSVVPTLATCGAPPVLAEWAMLSRGLVLCTGATGSGKSSTLAAMVDHRNRHTAGHILTIEDPIEFVHPRQGCLVTQREVGTHVEGFAQALRSALREDPDVILVGELRDLETIRLALTAAETGHLVLATLHTGEAAQVASRLVDVFPGGEQATVRTMLAESLQGVVAQVLCRRADGPGRVAAHEVLRATPAVRHLIREDKPAQLRSVMQSGLSQGMQTLDQHLATLARKGTITLAEARAHARHPETLP